MSPSAAYVCSKIEPQHRWTIAMSHRTAEEHDGNEPNTIQRTAEERKEVELSSSCELWRGGGWMRDERMAETIHSIVLWILCDAPKSIYTLSARHLNLIYLKWWAPCTRTTIWYCLFDVSYGFEWTTQSMRSWSGLVLAVYNDHLPFYISILLIHFVVSYLFWIELSGCVCVPGVCVCVCVRWKILCCLFIVTFIGKC